MTLINLFCITSLRSDLIVRKFFTVSALGYEWNSEKEHNYDIVIVGGGIVGTATARELAIRNPKLKLAIIEKENRLAVHQSGHNSGVIHAGIYYKPGSLKAKLCVEGSALAYDYCDQKKIPYKKVGKLIVAVNHEEVDRLNELYQRGLQNGVKDMILVQQNDIQKYEPNCVGLKAIWSPHTGIVDWAQVNQSFGKDFESLGGQIYTNFKANKFELEDNTGDQLVKVIDNTGDKVIRTRFVVTAAGLHADRIAKLTNGQQNPRIVPFRGEYLILKKEKSQMVRTNIYPVPDPRFPFLGIHFTPRMDGSVWLGPNAVLSLKREGYKKSDFSLSDVWETIRFSGFRNLALKYLGPGFSELYRSFRTTAQVELLRKYVPSLTIDDIEPKTYSTGIRAQALDEKGNLVDDFVFDSGSDEIGKRVLHVRNAPSPAATSSLAIAKMIAEKTETLFLNK
ncbi:L-2-hydroxyglutarate dehydrogenase, mitochondrial-like [Oppia nitens]|uniref:L-2-hydroxyglutarate dehydrogenase, mitochondrial-like n=1 Tax=Oppia nitens TaxID=1686743 RepID=UPI0023DA54CA|nr:L-2-hydroxyglutarate dehydrogenase, mitochondrial-like [Oppia nitens]